MVASDSHFHNDSGTLSDLRRSWADEEDDTMRNRISGIGECLVLAFVVFGVVSVIHAQTYKFGTLYSFKSDGQGPFNPSAL